MTNPILAEAKRLFDLGWAPHWIRPNSKAPVEAGWSGPVRDPIEKLVKTYHDGYGLGVRLGEASKLIGGGYLANIDVDIKSSDPRHREEALAFLDSRFPGLKGQAPIVKTGYGLRVFVRTETPEKSGKLKSSNEEAVVYLPTTEINRRQQLAVQEGKLTTEQLNQGFRVRPAWEIEFMSAGKQVVLPPSIHPETKKPYAWGRALGDTMALPLVAGLGDVRAEPGRPLGTRVVQNFEPVTVDLIGSSLSDRIVEMILKGADNRSDAMLSIAMAMVGAKFSDQEIISVLTDPTTPVGEAAYEHAKTKKRAAAAGWVRDYTLRRAHELVGAGAAFKDAVEVSEDLKPEEIAAQAKEIAKLDSPVNWRSRIQRTGKDYAGPPAKTLKNVVLILTHAVAQDVFKRDLFALRDFNGCDTPWGGVKGGALTDDDGVRIKFWLAERFNFEPSKELVYEAMAVIACNNGFHPVREKLNALPSWDGVGRIDGWLEKNFEGKGPQEYLAQVFRKWLVASVTRTFEPGAKFDWMVLLQGAQGTGKSSFGSILFGEDYFCDWLPQLSDKDAALGLQGIRCVEFGELDQLRRNELETTKAFITRRVDKVRPPYGKRWLESKRQCVFFGTTNKDEYLKDDSGNRRFNPVEVGHLNFEALARDKDQLWAEALFIYWNGLEPSLYLEGEAEIASKEIQSSKMVADEATFMAESIRIFIAKELLKPKEQRFDFSRFKLTTLFMGGHPLEKWPENGRSLFFAAKALKDNGGVKKISHGLGWWRIDEKWGVTHET